MTGKDDTDKDGSATIGQVHERRRLFRDALAALEKALATPTGRGEEWHDRVVAALGDFSATTEHHIEETEGPDGFFAQVLSVAPRLDPAVRRLRTEHERIRTEIDDLALLCEKGEDAVVIRERALELLRATVEHRQSGSDLLYEAYEVDISAGD